MFPGSFRPKLNVVLAAVRLCSQPRRSLHTLPFLSFPFVARLCVFHQVNCLIENEEWTFLVCVSLGTGHNLNSLATRWSTATHAFITCRSVGSIQDVDCVRIAPVELRRRGEIVSLRKKDVGDVFFLFP